jgi:DNA-binding NarL/FixJ family response regulator
MILLYSLDTSLCFYVRLKMIRWKPQNINCEIKTIQMEKIRVFLSDPQVLFREGIHFILSGEEDFEVTGESTGNEEAYPLIEANPPNIAVLSLQDAKIDGGEITRRIKRGLPSISVILTLEKKDEDKLFQAVKSGASAFLTKDTDPDYLLDIIRVVAQGSQPIIDELLAPALASRALADFKDVVAINKQVDNLLADLGAKESQILSSIASGNNLEQVAVKLDINEETIRRNLRMVQSKLVNNDQAHSLFEAAQRSLPVLIRSKAARDTSGAQYVTRAEFIEFKESLIARFKSLINEKS